MLMNSYKNKMLLAYIIFEYNADNGLLSKYNTVV